MKNVKRKKITKSVSKQSLVIMLFAVSLCLFGCHKNESPYNPPADEPINEQYSKKDTINALLEQYVQAGLPGVEVTIYSAAEGWWESARGFASLETQKPMTTSTLHYLQSIAKTYMAVGILDLWSNGRINLDVPITKYLPRRFADCVTDANKITVRNLLNHQSGIAEYTEQPEYVSYLIGHPDHRFTSEELMNYIRGKGSLFTPGSKFSYTNTNFELLAFIADSITGDHSAYLYKKIIQPLNLSKTYYRYDQQYLNYPELPESYLDMNGTGIIANFTQMQKANVASMVGDDGMVATPRDAVRFLRGLFSAQLLNANAMQEMKHWVKDEEGNNIQGMGLYYINPGGIEGYGHGGSGIGEGCGVYYFPSKQLYVFMGTNIGTILPGPLVDKVNELKIKLLSVLLQ